MSAKNAKQKTLLVQHCSSATSKQCRYNVCCFDTIRYKIWGCFLSFEWRSASSNKNWGFLRDSGYIKKTSKEIFVI